MREEMMATEVRVETIVLPGGKIEISTPELTPGKRATVVVMIEDNEPDDQRHVIDILSALPGHQIFHSAEEVDAYVLKERDSWEG
jgi:hypothetical protein